MIKININEDASYDNLPVLKEILRKHDWDLKYVSMVYNLSKGLPNVDSPESWPFSAVFDGHGKEVMIRIRTLTVGYGGTGPHDFASILHFLGIQYDEEEIFTKKCMDKDGYIRLHYSCNQLHC